MALKAKQSRRSTELKTQALEEAGKEEMKRLNLDIPASLHSRIRLQAVKDETLIREIVIAALHNYLDEE